MKNSNIILAKDINLDKSYTNVLNYTNEQMLNLMRSQEHIVMTQNNYSFLNKDVNNIIQVQINYDTCIQANYIAYQNTSYSNKWFFGFIDNIKYINDKTTEIHFTIDVWTTWFSYWNTKSCYVLREHVEDDTIGLHTYPEGLERGEYIIDEFAEVDTSLNNYNIIIACTEVPSNTPNLPESQFYGGVFSGLYYLAFDDMTSAKKFLLAYDEGKRDAIVNMFMLPDRLCRPISWYTANLGNQNDIKFGIIGNSYGAIILNEDISITQPQKLKNYVPKNNKLLCYPYQALTITNNGSGSADFRYEDFIDNTPKFNMAGVICPGASIKLYPINNKKFQSSASLKAGYNDGLMCSKFPTCSWNSDPYTNWLTQQAINIPTRYANVGLSALSSISGLDSDSTTASGIGIFQNTFNQLMSIMNEKYQHDLQPAQASGNLNAGDVNFSLNKTGFSYYKMCIKEEYAKIIDDFFTRYGYQVNTIKVPNLTSRPIFNYIQIGASDDIGYSNNIISVPANDMNEINNICRRGTTIWHNHDNIGNFLLDNK